MNIDIPFLERWKSKMLTGHKTATSRSKRYGNIGDTFTCFGVTFQLVDVSKQTLTFVAVHLYDFEGCSSPEQFRRVWEELHPRRGYIGSDKVWVHRFEKVAEITGDEGSAPCLTWKKAIRCPGKR